LLQSEAVLTNKLIDSAVQRSLSCLRSNFRTTENGQAGWYHYLDDPKPGVTASAVGLYCFWLADASFERTDQVVKYLLSQGVKADAGTAWGVRTTSGVPIVEATAWVLRALSVPQARSPETSAAVNGGIAWLEGNQNTDLGWGSYKGEPSRVFHTALSILALLDAGGSPKVISNGIKWLIEAQSPQQPAWGPLPSVDPTMFHTSVALMALTKVAGSLPGAAVNQTEEWLFERLTPGEHVEEATSVEEYNVPYVHNEASYTFQNSLPHFAGPVALTALLDAGVDPLQAKIFQVVGSIINSQDTSESLLAGTWRLPRSPTRPSIWAVWPFVAALTTARRRVVPCSGSTATLLFTGCAIVQSEGSARHLTRRLLIRNAALDWLRERKIAVGLWTIALVFAIVLVVLWATSALTLDLFLPSLFLPVLILAFQILWDRRSRLSGR
jgi:hypothetical protein